MLIKTPNKTTILKILSRDFQTPKWCQTYFIRYANKVTVDDEVLVQGNGELISEKVVNVSSQIMQGTMFYVLA